MRWDLIFADLECLLDSDRRAEFDGSHHDHLQLLQTATSFTDRVRGQLNQEVTFILHSGDAVTGIVEAVGDTWVALARPSSVVLTAAVAVVRGLRPRTTPASAWVMPLPIVIRALARDRAPVRLHLREVTLEGTIDGIGGDYCELAEHPIDEPRRQESVRSVATVPFIAIQWIQLA